MRRVAILFVSLLGLLAGVLVAAPTAQAVSAPSGVKAVAGTSFDAVIVGWKWSTKPAAYVVQIAERKSFVGARQVKVAAKGGKPAGGRQTYKFTGLEDGTKFFVRVAAATKGGKKSGWSAIQSASTRTRFPSAPSGPVKAVAGPGAGELTFTWSTAGDYTDNFKIETATAPFDKATDREVFKVDPKVRSYTMTAAQTAQAGAGIGTGWTLLWRFTAVNSGTSGKSEERYFGQGQSRVQGEAPTGTGSPIRVASYNIRVERATGDPAELTWDRRIPRIVNQINDVKPGIVVMQELFPLMVPKFVAGLGVRSPYALDSETPLVKGSVEQHLLQNRILYDTTKYEKVTPACSTPVAVSGCYITWPTEDVPDNSPFLRLRDKASGQEFYVLGLHLPEGEGLDAQRTKSMKSILDQIDALREQGIPVIVAGDTNSNQLRTGERPHDALMAHGYYDTASTVEHVNPEYGTVNEYQPPVPSPFGISPRIDVIATLGMPGSAKFVNEIIKKGDPFPSDHDMIWTDLRLP